MKSVCAVPRRALVSACGRCEQPLAAASGARACCTTAARGRKPSARGANAGWGATARWVPVCDTLRKGSGTAARCCCAAPRARIAPRRPPGALTQLPAVGRECSLDLFGVERCQGRRQAEQLVPEGRRVRDGVRARQALELRRADRGRVRVGRAHGGRAIGTGCYTRLACCCWCPLGGRSLLVVELAGPGQIAAGSRSTAEQFALLPVVEPVTIDA